LQEWEKSVPECISVEWNMLRGLYLLEDDLLHDTKMVKYFPLSLVLRKSNGDMKRRFEILFAVRSKWTQEEMLPYIEDLAIHSGDMQKALDAILLKFTRKSKMSGQVSYTSRLASRVNLEDIFN
jgi:hypothetical protein